MSTRSIGMIVLALLFAAGCQEGSSPEQLTFTRAGGDNQTAVAGQAVPVAPSVRVARDGGTGVQGVTVVFAVVSGGGAVAGATQTTNADGVATVGSWTLGPTVGPNTLTATVQGRDIEGGALTFTATSAAGPAANLDKQAGDGQNGTVATPVGTPPAVLVSDAFGNPVAGVTIAFTVASGGGSVAGANAVTGTNGIAAAGSWVLGEVAGANTLTAQATGLSGSPATFTATAAAGPAASLSTVEGDDQTAPISTQLAIAPKVLARDAFGNDVSGVPVDFAVSLGGGAVTAGSQTTGPDGTAAVGTWTLGPTPGPNQLTATATGTGITGNPIVFDATATALFNVSRYLGTWTGTWINNTFSSVGTNTLTITADESAMTVTIAFSTTGNALGTGGGVPTQSNMTAYDGSGFTATATLNVYGTATITVDADGDITASGVNIPGGGFEGWDATGTITDTQLVLDWTITFTGGGTATGRTTLNRQ